MRGGIARYSRYGHELNFLAVRGLGDDFPVSASIDPSDEKEFLSAGMGPMEISQAQMMIFFQRYQPFVEKRGIELIVPMIVHDELVGLVMLGEKATGEPFSSADRAVVQAMARHIGVGIYQRNLLAELERKAEQNRRLYEEMRLTYADTVRSFAAAIDYKDKYTEGHSVRVGKYSELIARQLGWSDERIEGVAVAGYLHDVGKLTVERNIINSPTRINAKESKELSKHPVVGYDILVPIHHPYTDVPLAAKYHHERLDGRGYPDGLEDEQIPYIAKIVCVADSFDAMTTNRPYKARRPANEVVEDLFRNSGKQFAPELVTALCEGMLDELTGKTKDRSFRKLLGREYMEAEGIVPMLKDALNGINATRPLTLIASG